MAERKVTNPVPAAKAPTTTKVKETVEVKKQSPRVRLFQKDNYMWMGIGAIVIAIGMFVMSGGKSENANQFDYNKVYSTSRITVAPILILLGLMIEVYAIFKKPKVQQ
jgi:hypothetical protein